MIKNVKLTVHGYVQGVGYRYFCVRQAERLGIYGYARNMPDDTVEVEAEGDENDLQLFISLLEHGPAAAEVTQIDKEWRESSGRFRDFYILS